MRTAEQALLGPALLEPAPQLEARSIKSRQVLWGLFLTVGLGLSFGACADCGGVQVEPQGFAGACSDDADCKNELRCLDEQCVQCAQGSDCASEELCQDGHCVADCPNDNRCESGGSCCPGTYECISQHCEPPCAGTRCGVDDAICCAANEVCQDQQCRLDCGSNARCGAELDLCCGDGELCYGQQCSAQGPACASLADCPTDQVCEMDLGICIDRTVIGDCEYHPPPGVFSPAIECQWQPNPNDPTPLRNDVVMTPVVANLTDDNDDGVIDIFDTPDLVFTSYDLGGDGCCNSDATLHIVSGACGPEGQAQTLVSIADPALDNSAGLAIADLTGDGLPEIVAMLNNGGHPQGTIAFQRNTLQGDSWSVLWRNDDDPIWNVHSRGGTQPSIADMNADGVPEVLVGNVAINGFDGSVLWDGLVSGAATGGIGNNAFLGPVSTVADLDLDGDLELLAGNSCYDHNGVLLWTYPFTTDNSPCGGQLPCDGYTATANFDDDDEGEVVIIRRGEVFILQHTGELLFQTTIPVDDCANNESGPPTVADFDGDNHAEIGTAAGDYYAVIDPDCVGNPLPAGCTDTGLLWAVPNQDCSSRVTASSVFDFDGDGEAEVVYADEISFRILRGRDGQELFVDNSHHSHTRLEMPVIADVDNDGNAEVIIAENGENNPLAGVVIWGDSKDNWVFTRRIWNQHSYHVTNIGRDGVLPGPELPNWLQDGYNNFRQNTQGEGLFFAPDLKIVNVNAQCQLDLSLHLSFDLMNQGSRMVGSGVAASIYLDDSLAITLYTTQVLFPGQSQHFSWDWPVPEARYFTPINLRVVADDLGDGQGAHNECDDGGEDNNAVTLDPIACGPEG